MDSQSSKSSFVSSRLVHIASFAFILGIFGLAFTIILSELEFSWKILALSVATAVLGGIFFRLYRFNEHRAANASTSPDKFAKDFAEQLAAKRQTYLEKSAIDETLIHISQNQNFSEEVEAKISALREMRLLLGSALSLADSFRMVSSQVSEFVPFSTCLLLQPSETQEKLFVTKAVGKNAEEFERLSFDLDRGLAAQVFTTNKAALDENFALEGPLLPDNFRFFNTAIAVPLEKQNEVFGVLAFYSTDAEIYDETSVYLLKKLAPAMSDFLFQSISLERNQANALTDPLTQLPNERAFRLLLEQRIAECHRFRGTRSFSVLSFDIEKFSEINDLYGFLVGDRILSSVAFLVKQQLRQMDVLARSHGDEFLILLPNVEEEKAQFISKRIQDAVSTCSFDVAPDKTLKVKVNVGCAVFSIHGATLKELLDAVSLDRQRNKLSVVKNKDSRSSGQVLSFPLRRVSDK